MILHENGNHLHLIEVHFSTARGPFVFIYLSTNISSQWRSIKDIHLVQIVCILEQVLYHPDFILILINEFYFHNLQIFNKIPIWQFQRSHDSTIFLQCQQVQEENNQPGYTIALKKKTKQ